MSATTLVLEGGDPARRPGFEIRVPQVVRRTSRSHGTPQEVPQVDIDEQAKGELGPTK